MTQESRTEATAIENIKKTLESVTGRIEKLEASTNRRLSIIKRELGLPDSVTLEEMEAKLSYINELVERINETNAVMTALKQMQGGLIGCLPENIKDTREELESFLNVKIELNN